RYNTDVASTEQLLRIIQSIPSPKAEPFKMWLAQVGRERIEETIDPELTIDRALAIYLKKGYPREWVNQRLQAIQVRKELTDEWDDRGVRQGVEYAILTDEITQGDNHRPRHGDHGAVSGNRRRLHQPHGYRPVQERRSSG
ncbi:MAG: Bro-N domain-containing protein, partial [Methylobacteriaceae bacterium]|nr:Bro-N domain-containing protein [Methylobacteriaceae bacterium]